MVDLGKGNVRKIPGMDVGGGYRFRFDVPPGRIAEVLKSWIHKSFDQLDPRKRVLAELAKYEEMTSSSDQATHQTTYDALEVLRANLRILDTQPSYSAADAQP